MEDRRTARQASEPTAGHGGGWRRGLLRAVGALAGGAGMAMLFPPFDLGGLVWLTMLPLLAALWSVDGRRPGLSGFGLGFLAGLVFFLISLHWLTVVSPVGWVALSAYLAVFPALWGWFAASRANPWRPAAPGDGGASGREVREESELARGSWRPAMDSLRTGFAVAAVWCGLEWLRGWLFTGFGWNGIGVAFHETPVIAQSADLLGVCGLSFVPVFLQAVMLQTGRRLFIEARAGKRRAHPDFAVAAVLLALCVGYGVWRLASVGRGESVKLKALLVQLNIPQEAARRLWSLEEIHRGYEEETVKALEAISERDAERFRERMSEGETIELNAPDWILWPESALVGRVLRKDDGAWAMWAENLDTIARVREMGQFTMMMGLSEAEAEPLGTDLVEMADARVWNSLVVLPPDGSLMTFRKHHLVIFGEYIPLVDKLPFLKAIYEHQAGAEYGGAYAVGDSFEPLAVDVKGGTVGVLPSVCFEDTVPRLMRKFVRDGPQIIVNVTNDGWFKDSPAAAQHFANARFRAIELRRPMIRCANSGVSAAVNAVGSTAAPGGGGAQELRDEAGNHLTRGWLLAEVEIPREPPLTLYALIGDWGVIGLGVLGLLSGRRRR